MPYRVARDLIVPNPDTELEVLETLFSELNLNARIVITDDVMGAGYIVNSRDLVLVRWSDYRDARNLLLMLLRADKRERTPH